MFSSYSKLSLFLTLIFSVQLFAQTPRLFWAYQADYNGKVQSAGIDGSNLKDIATNKEQPFGLAVDWKSDPQKVYYCERNESRIIRANLDGSDPEEIITEVDGIRDLELDPVSRKIYWIRDTFSDDAIQRANMDNLNSQIEEIYTNKNAFVGSHGIALDHINQQIYWVEGDNGCSDKIRRINFDKTGLQTIITHPNDGLGWPWDIDVVGDKIYWIDGSADVLYRANHDGTQIDSVFGEIDGEYFVVDSSASTIYISERNKISRANIDGSGRATVVSGLGNFLMGIDIAYNVSLTAIPEKEYTTIGFHLHQNYPNPFNPKTTISYQLPVASQVELSIYNLSGQKAATLVSGNQTAGIHTVEWNANEFASGIYLYKLSADKGFTQSRKLILLK